MTPKRQYSRKERSKYLSNLDSYLGAGGSIRKFSEISGVSESTLRRWRSLDNSSEEKLIVSVQSKKEIDIPNGKNKGSTRRDLLISVVASILGGSGL